MWKSKGPRIVKTIFAGGGENKEGGFTLLQFNTYYKAVEQRRQCGTGKRRDKYYLWSRTETPYIDMSRNKHATDFQQTHQIHSTSKGKSFQ